ncbi:MAG TPA: bile acid:sodium symporter [Casimicrobiaceae bacterium]|jgi:predicted Na+-dependent transporter|nr:bile acid:sodium symporter [Casimicrobiaceae bacterium]
MSGPVPEWVLNALAVGTVFTVMFGLGLGISAGELRLIWRRPGLMARGLFSVLVAVPAVALLVTRFLDLPRFVEIGLVLMAISPGAPIALRRSLGAGGHRAFAPSLQICVALFAVISMPLSIAALNELYAGRASITPWSVAKQVLIAQLLPLTLGMTLRRFRRPMAERIEPRLARIGNLLIIVLLAAVLIDVWEVTMDAGVRVWPSIALITVGALALGHWLGGPEPATRTAVAITSALRNAGLALLVATLNSAPPAVTGTVLAYVLVSALLVVPYIMWRRRAVA